jgi:hypothetical protein
MAASKTKVGVVRVWNARHPQHSWLHGGWNKQKQIPVVKPASENAITL